MALQLTDLPWIDVTAAYCAATDGGQAGRWRGMEESRWWLVPPDLLGREDELNRAAQLFAATHGQPRADLDAEDDWPPRRPPVDPAEDQADD